MSAIPRFEDMLTIGFIGLGRMGLSMARRLLDHKIKVVVYNRTQSKVRALARYGAEGAVSLEELIEKLPKRKIVWLMLPAGIVTQAAIDKLFRLLNKGDIIIDGSNDFFEVAKKRARAGRARGIHFFDIGVSGGVWGYNKGYTLMVGGPKQQFKIIKPLCQALSPQGGYGYFGESGAGHFVKSVHNIIEYVYLEGLAEGAELLKNFRPGIDVKQVFEVWAPASVIRSWLVDLVAKSLSRKDFEKIGRHITSVTTEELVKTKKRLKAFLPAFDAAVQVRRSKNQKFKFGKRLIAALRREFGGHEVKEK